MPLIPAALQTRLRSPVTTFVTCWRVELHDGTYILGTEHNRDIRITTTDIGRPDPGFTLNGVYKSDANIAASATTSRSDMSADNMEIESAPSFDVLVPDLTRERIDSGVADMAPAFVFLVDWQAPDDGQIVTARGTLGEFAPDSTGRLRTEVRRLTQALSQTVAVGTYGTSCSVKRLGDAQCKLNVDALMRTGVVTAVASRRQFSVALTPSTAPPWATYFSRGEVSFTSGQNAGFVREVKTAPVGAGVALIDLWEETAADVEIGDAVTLRPGCNRTYEECVDFGNVLNFRGYGIYISGIDELMAGPTSSSLNT